MWKCGLCSFLMHQQLIYERSNRFVYELDGKYILKIGTDNTNEAETMMFVREKTTLPVPRVISHWTHGGHTYILMEKMSGATLESLWPILSADERHSILAQLKCYIEQMRKVEFHFIGAVNREPTMEYFVSKKPFGPLTTLDDMHKLRVNELQLEGVFADYALGKRNINDIKFVLSHNDLGPYNILIESGRITAILDWELSGSYPDYWEYARNLFHCGYDQTWKSEMEKILKEWCFDGEIKRIEWVIYLASVFTNEYNDEEDRQQTRQIALEFISGKRN